MARPPGGSRKKKVTKTEDKNTIARYVAVTNRRYAVIETLDQQAEGRTRLARKSLKKENTM